VQTVDDWDRQEAEEAFARFRLRVEEDSFEDFATWEHEVGTWDEGTTATVVGSVLGVSETWQDEFAAFTERSAGRSSTCRPRRSRVA
jgi:hypothetical protein